MSDARWPWCLALLVARGAGAQGAAPDRQEVVLADSGFVAVIRTASDTVSMAVVHGLSRAVVRLDSTATAVFASQSAAGDSAARLRSLDGVGTVTMTRLGADTTVAVRLDVAGDSRVVSLTFDAGAAGTLGRVLRGLRVGQ